MMISDIERKKISKNHAQALQALLDMGFINYENNKFCIVLGYTIDSTIHYNDCRDCQTKLKEERTSFGNAPNKMADEKKNRIYKYIHSLTYEQNLKMMPYTLERMKMA